jgi:hypothetical protein
VTTRKSQDVQYRRSIHPTYLLAFSKTLSKTKTAQNFDKNLFGGKLSFGFTELVAMTTRGRRARDNVETSNGEPGISRIWRRRQGEGLDCASLEHAIRRQQTPQGLGGSSRGEK